MSWSDAQGGTARAMGSSITIPAALDAPPTYLIYGEMSYTYTPMFGYFGNGTAFTLSDNLYVMPRSTSSITRLSP